MRHILAVLFVALSASLLFACRGDTTCHRAVIYSGCLHVDECGDGFPYEETCDGSKCFCSWGDGGGFSEAKTCATTLKQLNADCGWSLTVPSST